MAVQSYQLADGTGRWMYIFDLAPGSDCKRRQAKKRGFLTREAALEAQAAAQKAFGHWRPAAGGTVAAGPPAWTNDREIDLRDGNTVNWYRRMFTSYVIPYIGHLPMHRLDSRAINALYTIGGARVAEATATRLPNSSHSRMQAQSRPKVCGS